MQFTENFKDFLIVACGDAVAWKYVKRFFIEKKIGIVPKFYVRAAVDGGAKNDDWIIVDIFESFEEARNFLRKIIAERN